MASFTNVATLSYGGNQVSSNVVTGEIREVLTVSKTAVPAGLRRGGHDHLCDLSHQFRVPPR